MGKEQHRTDYTDREVFARHALEAMRRHDKYTITQVPIVVNFDPNFDEFAAKVAYELRGRVIYRTDGGRNARGAVRANGDLKTIHDLFMTGTPPPPTGSKIRLIAMLARRRDPRAHFRWVMSISFNVPDWIDEDDAIEITASPAVTAASKQNLMRNLIHYAVLHFQDIHNDRARRVLKMLEIAERLGYPRNEDMWYYSRRAVYLYVRWEAGQPGEDTNPNSRRRKMSAKTGGVLPFDGDTGFPEHVDWRIYPFRSAALQCMGRDADVCTAKISNELINAEDEMLRTFNEIDKEISRVFNVPTSLNPFSFTGKSAAALGPLGLKFLIHLNGLSRNKDTLYSVYPPPPSFWFGDGYHP